MATTSNAITILRSRLAGALSRSAEYARMLRIGRATSMASTSRSVATMGFADPRASSYRHADIGFHGGGISRNWGDNLRGEDMVFSKNKYFIQSAIGVPSKVFVDTRPRVVFILGGPGAGKGTQCSKLTNEFGCFRHISAGDLLRDERNSGSARGNLIEEYIREGKIVPVDITAELLRNAIEKEKHRYDLFLVDGFPRNLDNLRGWRDTVSEAAAVEFLVLFECSEQEMHRRLLKRGETSGRIDDNEATIRKRFLTYKGETMPVVRYFESRGRLCRIDADRSVSEVYAELRRALQPFGKRRPFRFPTVLGRGAVYKTTVVIVGAVLVVILGNSPLEL